MRPGEDRDFLARQCGCRAWRELPDHQPDAEARAGRENHLREQFAGEPIQPLPLDLDPLGVFAQPDAVDGQVRPQGMRRGGDDLYLGPGIEVDVTADKGFGRQQRLRPKPPDRLPAWLLKAGPVCRELGSSRTRARLGQGTRRGGVGFWGFTIRAGPTFPPQAAFHGG